MATYEADREKGEALPDRRAVLIEAADASRSSDFSIARRQGPWRDALLRRMLAVADLIAGLSASASLAFASGGRVHVTLWAALFAPLWVVVAKVLGLYDRDQRSLRHLTVDELPRILTWALTGTASVALLLALTPVGWVNAAEVLRIGIVSAVAALVLRVVARFVWRRVTPPETAVIVGQGASAAALRRKLELFPDIHVSVESVLPELRSVDLREPTPLLLRTERLLVASSMFDDRLVPELVGFCRRHHVKLSLVPPERAMFGSAVELNYVADLPLLEYNTWDVSRSTQFLKRLIDIAISSIALVVLAPLMFLIALLVLVDSGRPVLFRQVRVGAAARPFTMLKFRTMVRNAETLLSELVPLADLEEPVFKLRTDPRVTRVGRMLRRLSLDEIPQLLNVLRGEMSLVGPRPEQLELVERYEPEHLFRLAVKPGMTGPMQVYGRGELSFEERLAVEREYVENISVARDVHIIALTFASMLQGRGAF